MGMEVAEAEVEVEKYMHLACMKPETDAEVAR